MTTTRVSMAVRSPLRRSSESTAMAENTLATVTSGTLKHNWGDDFTPFVANNLTVWMWQLPLASVWRSHWEWPQSGTSARVIATAIAGVAVRLTVGHDAIRIGIGGGKGASGLGPSANLHQRARR